MSMNANTVDCCTFFTTDPSITSEVLTPEVLEEIGGLKMDVIEAMMPHWTIDTDAEVLISHIEILAMELDGLTPHFIRALAKAMKAPVPA